jgi:hypothetical protein
LGACAWAACSFRVDGLLGAAGSDLAIPPLGHDASMGGAGDGDMALAIPDMAKRGKLSVTSAVTSGSPIDLTAVGTLDWAHWGLSNPTDFDHKATGATQIADFVQLPNTTVKQFNNFPTAFNWSDGSSMMGGTTTSGNSMTGVYSNGGGFRVVVPASTTARRLIVYVSLLNAQARMQIALGDNSAPAHDDSMWQKAGDTIEDVAYVIDFAAGSDGQQLSISWSLAQGFIGAFPAAVGLESAALTTPP